MNILQIALTLTLCLAVRGDVKRELGFSGIGSYHGTPGNSNIGRTNFNQFGGSKVGTAIVPAIPLQFSKTAPAHTSEGFGGALLNFGGFGQSYSPQAGAFQRYSSNFIPVGRQQGFGGYNLNEGFKPSAPFNPVIIQPVKGVSFEQGWKGIESGPGSLREGHAIANAAFGGSRQKIIPVHEDTFENPQLANTIRIAPLGLSPFAQNHGQNVFGIAALGGAVRKGYVFPSHVPSIGGLKTAIIAPIFNQGSHFPTQIATVQHRIVPISNFLGSSYNVHGIGSSVGGLKNAHFQQKHVGFTNFGAAQNNIVAPFKGLSNSGHGFSNKLPNGHHPSYSSGNSNFGPSQSSSHGTSAAGGHGTGSNHVTSSSGGYGGGHIAPGHGTNGHGPGHAHETSSKGKEKATSYQSFVIHSYKPVPVYAKKVDSKHSSSEKNERSHQRENHSYESSQNDQY